MKLSAEKVHFTNTQLQKIVKAMGKGESVKLRLNKSQLKGNYPVFLGATALKKVQTARVLGKGCSCELTPLGMKKMKKDKIGGSLYMFGQGPMMFGTSRKPKRVPRVPKLPKPVQEVMKSEVPAVTLGSGLTNNNGVVIGREKLDSVPLKVPYPSSFVNIKKEPKRNEISISPNPITIRKN